jgi:hypothetical protein
MLAEEHQSVRPDIRARKNGKWIRNAIYRLSVKDKWEFTA